MGFLNRVENVITRSVLEQINTRGFLANPHAYQAARCFSSQKVFVGGTSYGTDENSLRELFGKYGEVLDVRIVLDRETGRSRGFGFITFSSPEEASSAIQALDGKELHGRILKVSPAHDRTPGAFPRYPTQLGSSGNYGGGSYGGDGGTTGGYGGPGGVPPMGSGLESSAGFGGPGGSFGDAGVGYGPGGGSYGGAGRMEGGYGGGSYGGPGRGDGFGPGGGGYGGPGGGDGYGPGGSFGSGGAGYSGSPGAGNQGSFTGTNWGGPGGAYGASRGDTGGGGAGGSGYGGYPAGSGSSTQPLHDTATSNLHSGVRGGDLDFGGKFANGNVGGGYGGDSTREISGSPQFEADRSGHLDGTLGDFSHMDRVSSVGSDGSAAGDLRGTLELSSRDEDDDTSEFSKQA